MIEVSRVKKIQLILASLGLLPFVFSTVIILFFSKAFPFETVQLVLRSYCLVIAVFMSGIWWGQQLSDVGPIGSYLCISSNVMALAAWFVWLTCSGSVFYLGFFCLFSCILAQDFFLFKNNLIEIAYLKLRAIISSVVLLCLILIGVC